MRIAIVGAGALGTYLATRLAESHDLTLLVRSHQVELVRSRGLRTCIGRREQRARVEVVDHLAESPELLVLAVKTQDLAEACRSVQPVQPATTVATLQNGIRADEIVRSVLNPVDLIGVVAMCAATCLEPGTVQVDVPGWLIAGAESAEPSRLHSVVDVFRQALPTFVTDNVVGARWMKLITNLNNGLSAATGLAWGELARYQRGRLLSIRLMREGYAVARACGIRLDRHLYGLGFGRLAPLAVVQGVVSTVLPDLPETVANRLLWVVGHLASRRLEFRGSTWQSIVRGRPSEIEYLNGEIVRQGQAVQVPTPYNARVVAAVRRAEQTAAFCSLEELWPARA